MRLVYLKILLISILISTATDGRAQDPLSHELDSLRMAFDTMSDGRQKLLTIYHLTYKHQNIDSARKYSVMGIDYTRHTGEKFYEADFVRFLAWSYAASGQPDSAIYYYSLSADLFMQCDSLNMAALTYYGIAETLESQGNVLDAIDYTLQMEQIGNQIDSDGLRALAYFRLGVIYTEMGAYSEARKYLLQSAEINISTNNQIQLANSYRELGRSYYAGERGLEQVSTAKAYFQEASDIFEANNDVFDLTYTYFSLCECCLWLSENDSLNSGAYLDSLLINYNKAAELCGKMGNYYYEPLLKSVYIEYLTARGDLKTAGKLLIQLKKSCGVVDSGIEQHIINTEYNLQKARGEWRAAFASLQRIIEIRKNSLLTENSVIVTAKTSSNDFLKQQRRREQDERENLMRMEEERVFQQKINKISSVILVILIAGILVMLIQYLRDRRTNRKLRSQKLSIMNQNDELYSQNEEILQQNQQIELQTSQIKEQARIQMRMHREIVDALESAETIQSALMPSRDKLCRMFGDVMVYWRPVGIVSGDFYWAAEVLGRRMVVAADCTGHGVPGAFMSTLGISSLNEICTSIRRSGIMPTAAEILRQLRVMVVSRISRPASKYEDSINDGMDLALCIFSPDGGSVQFSGAKRPLWLYRDGEVRVFAGDRITVGPDALGEKIDFTSQDIEVRNGDVIYMFSDGIPDQLGSLDNGKRRKFQTSQLKQVIESVGSCDFDQQWVALNTRLHEWEGPERQQTDDIVLLAIRVDRGEVN